MKFTSYLFFFIAAMMVALRSPVPSRSPDRARSMASVDPELGWASPAELAPVG